MDPTNLRFGGGTSETIVDPVIAIATLIAGILICILPRNKAIVPFLAACILIPTDQVLLVAGLHFHMIRVLIIFGMIRILLGASSGNVFSGGINKIDRAVIFLALTIAAAGVLLFRQSAALTYQLGELYTTFGVYFLLRFLMRDEADVQRVIRCFAYLVAILAVLMTYEQAKGWNPYALFGGARVSSYQSVLMRSGQFRAMGSFAQPILAGTFGAVMLPLFIGLWWTDRKRRAVAVMGMIGATVMVIASNSSTPISGYLAGLLALCLWPLRNLMRPIRWGIVLALVALHMVMKAPVWHLISRVDFSGGSSSYHRYLLVDKFIRHFSDWWLMGTNDHIEWGWKMEDTANHYVAVGQGSGLLAFIILIALIAYGFQYAGSARRLAFERKQALFFWALGAALFAHVVSFFGISYFDQTIVAWYALLAIISAAAARQVSLAAVPKLRRGFQPGGVVPELAPAGYVSSSSGVKVN